MNRDERRQIIDRRNLAQLDRRNLIVLHEAAIECLRERFAAGELSLEDFERKLETPLKRIDQLASG